MWAHVQWMQLKSPWILVYTHLNWNRLTGVLVYARNTNPQDTDKIQQISWAVRLTLCQGKEKHNQKISIRFY